MYGWALLHKNRPVVFDFDNEIAKLVVFLKLLESPQDRHVAVDVGLGDMYSIIHYPSPPDQPPVPDVPYVPCTDGRRLRLLANRRAADLRTICALPKNSTLFRVRANQLIAARPVFLAEGIADLRRRKSAIPLCVLPKIFSSHMNWFVRINIKQKDIVRVHDCVKVLKVDGQKIARYIGIDE